MAIFKCKMCGGNLEIAEGDSIAECEYCGTKQTVPKATDENLHNLFNRANTLRIKSEFDKAERLYEKIIQADATQAEAYWGLILCKYGIEYVDDPTTFKKVPTCHRASYDSIIADDDYKSALKNADVSQRTIYEEQAKEIDRIQKEILALAQKEETYDVFICYKETSADGKRTQDSVIANDIYYQLTQEGFKVFYAAITLEGKLGSAYEPIIFAALNSAKVMLVIGTKPEYFNAVWVKNEWSRFLKIIKKDRSKLLIPCYRDMDAYELPEEFAHLQAQDMAKIGFINDLVRGIKKVSQKGTPKQTETEEAAAGSESTLAPLLERVAMFLEDGDWESADRYAERVLDLDPKNAQAYFGKLMAELHIRTKDELKKLTESFVDKNNYQKAVRFADDAFKAEIEGYIECVKISIENAKKDEILSLATEKMNNAAYKDAKKLLASISDWKDANEKLALCDLKIKKQIALAEAKKHQLEQERLKAERIKKIITFLTVGIIAFIVTFLIVLGSIISPSGRYGRATRLMNREKYDKAYNIFCELDGYKDSAERMDTIRIMMQIENLKDVSTGDCIKLGLYEQDNNTTNGKEEIEWIVLEQSNGKALLLSKYVIDYMPYASQYANMSWEFSAVRKWLNENFMGTAFCQEAKTIMHSTTISPNSTADGRATHDNIFLLSVSDLNTYLPHKNDRYCKDTASAASKVQKYYTSDYCDWLLRTLGTYSLYTTYITPNSDLVSIGDPYNYYGIRPAMWIDLPD